MPPEAQIQITDLLNEHHWLVNLSRRLVLGESEADDVVQETMVRALRAPSARTIRGARAARAWLATAARNVVRERRRSGARRRHREEVAASSEVQEVDELALDRAELRERIARHVMELREPWRTAVVLRFYDGLDARTIAERTGAPSANAVRQSIRRGVASLRARLDAEDREGGVAAWAPIATAVAQQGTAVKASAVTAVVAWVGGLVLVAALVTAAVLPGPRSKGGPESQDVTRSLPKGEETAVVTRTEVDTAAAGARRPALGGSDAAPSSGIDSIEVTLVDRATGAPAAGIRWVVIETGSDEMGRFPGTIDGPTPNPVPLAQGVTARDGLVRFPRVDADVLNLMTERDEAYARGSWPIQVAQAEQGSVRIELDHGAVVTGRVVDGASRPRPDVHLVAQTYADGPIHLGRTDADGRFRLHRVADTPRGYELDEGGVAVPRRIVTTEVHLVPGSRYEAQLADFQRIQIGSGHWIEVGDARHVDLGDLVLPRQCRVVGRVVDEAGAAVTGALVSGRSLRLGFARRELWNWAEPFPWDADWELKLDEAVTDSRGRFELDLEVRSKKAATVDLMAFTRAGGRASITAPLPSDHDEVVSASMTVTEDELLEFRLFDVDRPGEALVTLPGHSRHARIRRTTKTDEERSFGGPWLRAPVEAGRFVRFDRARIDERWTTCTMEVAGYFTASVALEGSGRIVEVGLRRMPFVDVVVESEAPYSRPGQTVSLIVTPRPPLEERRNNELFPLGLDRDAYSFRLDGLDLREAHRFPVDPTRPYWIWVAPTPPNRWPAKGFVPCGPFDATSVTHTVTVDPVSR